MPALQPQAHGQGGPQGQAASAHATSGAPAGLLGGGSSSSSSAVPGLPVGAEVPLSRHRQELLSFCYTALYECITRDKTGVLTWYLQLYCLVHNVLQVGRQAGRQAKVTLQPLRRPGLPVWLCCVRISYPPPRTCTLPTAPPGRPSTCLLGGLVASSWRGTRNLDVATAAATAATSCFGIVPPYLTTLFLFTALRCPHPHCLLCPASSCPSRTAGHLHPAISASLPSVRARLAVPHPPVVCLQTCRPLCSSTRAHHPVPTTLCLTPLPARLCPPGLRPRCLLAPAGHAVRSCGGGGGAAAGSHQRPA